MVRCAKMGRKGSYAGVRIIVAPDALAAATAKTAKPDTTFREYSREQDKAEANMRFAAGTKPISSSADPSD